MLIQRPFVFPTPIGFDVNRRCHGNSHLYYCHQATIITCCSYYTKLGARVFVTHPAANENRRYRWKWRQHVLKPINILRALNTETCINRSWRRAGLPIFIPRTNVGTCHAQGNEKVERGFGRNEVKWTGMLEIRKKEIVSNGRNMHIQKLFWQTPLTAPGFQKKGQ